MNIYTESSTSHISHSETHYEVNKWQARFSGKALFILSMQAEDLSSRQLLVTTAKPSLVVANTAKLVSHFFLQILIQILESAQNT